jgi:hypothetical protein
MCINKTFSRDPFIVMQLQNNGDFQYLLADAAAQAFQYGNPDILCLPLVGAHMPGQDVLVINSATEFVHFLQYLSFNPNLAILVGFCGGTEEYGIVVLFQDIENPHCIEL